MKNILLGTMIFLNLALMGCSNKITTEEMVEAIKNQSKIYDGAEVLNSLYDNVVEFIGEKTYEENDSYITELELENLTYEIEKARSFYNDIDFRVVEKYNEKLIKDDKKDQVYISIGQLKTTENEMKSIIDLHEKIVLLGEDLSYSNKDIEMITEYNDEIMKSIDKMNLFGKEYDDFFKLYGYFKYDIGDKTASEIEAILKKSGYEYEKTEDKNFIDVLVFDKNSEHSIIFQCGKMTGGKVGLIQYNIGDRGSSYSTVDLTGIEDKVSYGGFNKETKEKPEFRNLDEQYEYVQSIKSNN